MSATAEKVRFEYDPFDRSVMENPLPYYRVLRDEYPVYYIEKYDMFVFSRFEDILEVLSICDNALVGSDTTLPGPQDLQQTHKGTVREWPRNPLAVFALFGSPLYDDVRQAQMKALRPKSVAQLESFMRQRASELLDELLPRKTFDLTREYGGILAASVMCKLMNMPLSLAPKVLDTVNEASLTDPQQGGTEFSKILQGSVELMLPFIAERRRAGADGSVPLIDGMINFRLDGRALTDEEIAVQLVCVFNGGTETVPKINAHGLMELAACPDQLEEVRADLVSNVPKAVEEMIRYCAPAQWFVRTAHKPLVIAGQRIEVGQRVMVLYGSANRDEREYPDPDRFIWNRPIRRLLAFGFGQHYCMGVHVGRLELRVLVEEFLKRVRSYSFDMSAAVRLPSSFQWGWNKLPVIIEALN